MSDIDWGNKDAVIDAVSMNGYNLKNASLELKNDPDVVISAVV